MGLHRAGFAVTGIDIRPQPRYPFTFHRGDALAADLSGYDFVAASPPCQAHSAMKTMPNAKVHADLIPATRKKLKAWGGLWMIENVVGAPLICPVMLCGTMFGLGTGKAVLQRHRLFELSTGWILTPPCHHNGEMVIGVYGGHGRDRRRVKPATVGVWGSAGGGSARARDGTQQFSTAERAEAMGIDWMNGNELSQAIPPAYAEFLGRYFFAMLAAREDANGGGSPRGTHGAPTGAPKL